MRQIRVNENSEIEAIVEFSQAYPWKPRYPSSMVRRFLTELISSRDLIFDFHDAAGPVATAVLLDKVNNPANDACLEILGIRNGFDVNVAVLKFLELAGAVVPKNRDGFQFGLPEFLAIDSDMLANLGLIEYYDTYAMRVELEETIECSKEVVDAIAENRDEIFNVLGSAFAQNPDTSIPECETWKRSFLRNPASHFYLWKAEGKIVGFANLVEDAESSEIRTIGVLPTMRGLGIGNKLLRHCLKRAKELGKNDCHLTVAVQNERALGLYLRAGFEIVEKFKCYRKPMCL